MAERMVWTRQYPAVLAELERTGRYLAREEAIRAKNGGMDQMAEFYLKLYRWYAREGARYVPKPADAEYPVWVCSSRWRARWSSRCRCRRPQNRPAGLTIRQGGFCFRFAPSAHGCTPDGAR